MATIARIAGVTALMMGTVISSVFGAEGNAETASGELSRQLDSIVQQGVEDKAYPGAVLIVGRPGEILHAKAYGTLTGEPGSQPMTMETIFDLASLTKVIGTATAAMKLIEEGKLGLADTVAKYIPSFAVGGKEKVTVRQLMTHVSGLKAYDSAANAEKARKAGQSSADAMIERIASLTVSNPPGTTVTYSCLNMQTQARVNETVLNGRMDDFLREKVYGPLGMKDTVYRLREEQKARVAPTARAKDGSSNAGSIHDPLANYHSSEEHCPGNAGLFSTAPDLARYCEMILRQGRAGEAGPQVFRPETIALMTSVQTPPELSNFRGLGWDVQRRPPYCTSLNQTDKTRVVTHTGYTGTMVWVDKLSNTYYVFLTNRTWPDDSSKSSRGVGKARREIARTILASRPEYKPVLGELEQEDDD